MNECHAFGKWVSVIVQWFFFISWRLFDIWIPYYGIMSQYDPMFDHKIFVAHCDLYFMVEWFCLISWNICRSLWPIFYGPLNLPFILKTVWCMNIIHSYYESVYHNIWPRNKCRSLWPIFHGPVILPYILNSIWSINVILLENWVSVIQPLTSK